MISFLRGVLEEALPTRVVMNVNGVGYDVLVPVSTYERLPKEGEEFKMLTHLQVREDDHVLYGFASKGERDLFRLLVTHVTGVGPKVALAILSGSSVEAFQQAVVSGDVAGLSKIKGLGKKTAERIVVELKDKVGVSKAWEQASPSAQSKLSPAEQVVNDAVLALIALGYKQAEAMKAMKTVSEEAKREGVEAMVREALKRI